MFFFKKHDVLGQFFGRFILRQGKTIYFYLEFLSGAVAVVLFAVAATAKFFIYFNCNLSYDTELLSNK